MCRLLLHIFPLSPFLLSLSLHLQTVSVLFCVALHIFGAAHKFGCPSASSALSLGAFVKNHCCYSNFMEIPTLFLAFSFQRTDLRLRKICLSYASLRLILQKTKKPKRKRRGRRGVGSGRKNYCWACSCLTAGRAFAHWEWLAAVQLWVLCRGVRKGGEGNGTRGNKKLFTTHKFPTLVLRHIILAGKHMPRNRHKFDFKAGAKWILITNFRIERTYFIPPPPTIRQEELQLFEAIFLCR